MLSISQIKSRADIREVWAALGGGPLRWGRGQAFWRNGDGYNVAIDSRHGIWYDHVSGEGGDVVALVQTVRKCGFLQAAEWLAQHTGVRVSEWIRRDSESSNDWATDLNWATWWRISAEALAEAALAAAKPPVWEQPCAERHGMTALLRTIRLGDAALVNEYREWRRRDPELTAAMAQAGRCSDARIQRRLMRWIVRTCGEATA